MVNNNREIRFRIAPVFAVTATVLLIAWNNGPFFYHFAEWRLITLYSFFQLGAAAYICFLVCRAYTTQPLRDWRQNASVRPFLICSVGFVFLGLDEILSLHENIDKLIHHVFFIVETPFTDHFDDFIVLIYGLVALFFIKDFIREFRKHPYMIAFLICGFLTFFAMVFLDYVTNSIETFLQFFKGESYADLMHKRDVYRMVEDSAKIIGETFFLTAFWAALIDIRIKKSKG